MSRAAAIFSPMVRLISKFGNPLILIPNPILNPAPDAGSKNRIRNKNKIAAIFAAALAALPAEASACAVCMGDPNSYLADATNSTIWMLLGLVGFIFISTGATAFYLWHHARAKIPPHIELVENMTEDSDED